MAGERAAVGHKGRVFCLSWRPAQGAGPGDDGDAPWQLASASEDQSVRIWRGDARLASKPLSVALRRAHASEVLRCAWSPSGSLLATGGADGKVHVYTVPPATDDDAGEPTRITSHHPCAARAGTEGSEAAEGEGEQVYGLAFAPDSEHLFIATDSRLCRVAAESARCDFEASITAAAGDAGGHVFGGERNESGSTFLFDLALSEDGALIALAASDGCVHVADARLPSRAFTGVTLRVADDDFASACAFVRVDSSGSLPLLAVACGGGACSVWDVRQPHAPLGVCSGHAGTAFACAPVAPGLLATTGRDKQVHVYDVRALSGTGEPPGGSVEPVWRATLPDRGLCCAGGQGMLAVAGGSGGVVSDTAVHLWKIDDITSGVMSS